MAGFFLHYDTSRNNCRRHALANVIKAVTSATKRSQELGQGLGELKYLYKNQKTEKKKKGRRGFCEVKLINYQKGLNFLKAILKRIK